MNRIIIILGIILAVLLAIAAFFTFFPSDSADINATNLDILGNGTIGENGTLNVKLSNGEGIALRDKQINVVIKDENGNVVFEDSAQTQVNGVANVKVENVSPGEYEVTVAFEGDENYSSCNITEKLIIAEGVVDEDADSDEGADDAADSDADSGSQASSSSYSGRSYSNGGGSSDSGSSAVPDGGSSDASDDGGNPDTPEPAPVNPDPVEG